jgi:hypothetical protein
MGFGSRMGPGLEFAIEDRIRIDSFFLLPVSSEVGIPEKLGGVYEEDFGAVKG